ncbi:MAG TPA: hypothetical protein VGK57_14720, partial [Candidatus Binatia bacterium]
MNASRYIASFYAPVSQMGYRLVELSPRQDIGGERKNRAESELWIHVRWRSVFMALDNCGIRRGC